MRSLFSRECIISQVPSLTRGKQRLKEWTCTSLLLSTPKNQGCITLILRKTAFLGLRRLKGCWLHLPHRQIRGKAETREGEIRACENGDTQESGAKVAVKIMNKKEMNNQDLELAKTEIEILKDSQQPNIIRLYDVYENLENI